MQQHIVCLIETNVNCQKPVKTLFCTTMDCEYSACTLFRVVVKFEIGIKVDFRLFKPQVFTLLCVVYCLLTDG